MNHRWLKHAGKWNAQASLDPSTQRFYLDDRETERFRAYWEQGDVAGVKDVTTGRLLLHVNYDDRFEWQIDGLSMALAEIIRNDLKDYDAFVGVSRHMVEVQTFKTSRVKIRLLDMNPALHGQFGAHVCRIDVDASETSAIEAATSFLRHIAAHLDRNPLNWDLIRTRQDGSVFCAV